MPQPRGGHPAGRRKVSAAAQYLADVAGPGSARGGDEQPCRLLGRKDVEGQWSGVVQVQRPVVVGDQGEAPAGVGEQAAYVVGVGGVVQHDDRAPCGELGPPQRGAFGDVLGDPVGWELECGQQVRCV
ncbi:hypothetical protein [Streptomyces sp. S186]|uniref:hypothetical protein n=1 Tax=Streptomyces sp. S186 TaxID=3434395 RepID=UPI003F67B87F